MCKLQYGKYILILNKVQAVLVANMSKKIRLKSFKK